jgi:Cu-Zn family superoxide dismutase
MDSVKSRLFVIVMVGAFFAGSLPLFASSDRAGKRVRATVQFQGCTDPNVSGVGMLTEEKSEEGVKEVDVFLLVKGLPPGKHAVHIHEVAACSPCGAAGGHFDPGPNGNSSPDGNHPFHMGDLVNLEVRRNGVGTLRTTTTRVTLSPGPLSVFDGNGSAIIIHVSPDSYCPDGVVAGCAGGARAACGVIVLDE